jgi:hypothetical protein
MNNSGVIAEASEIISLDTRAGLCDVTRDAILKSGTKLFFQGGCDSSIYPYESDHVMQPWFDREDGDQHLSKLLGEKKITEKERDYQTNFYENSF